MKVITERITTTDTELNPMVFEIGDVITFDLNDGETVKAMAVKLEDDGMIFCHVDCLERKYRMNTRNINGGGYDASELRKKLNSELLDRYPRELRDAMQPFDNGDLLRIPTEKEIFGENSYGEWESENVHQWEPMKLRRNRMAFQGDNGFIEWYWLQNRVKDTAAAFALVGDLGLALYNSASTSLGVRPAFKIKNR